MKMLLCAFVLIFCNVMFAETPPDWVTNNGKSGKFPTALYLTGYSAATASNGVSREQAEELALENARKNLIEKISISIHSVTISKTEEVGEKYSSFFNSAVQSTSNMEIQGLESLRYYDDETAYAFVYVKREIFQATYKHKVQVVKKEIDSKIKTAQSLEAQKKTTHALEEYLSCMPLVRQLEESQTILSFINISNTLTELEQTAETSEVSAAKIREAIHNLTQKPVTSIDDLAWYLAFQLKEQLKQENNTSLFVSPLVYQDTKMGSSFSRFFNQVMEQKINEVTKWNVVQAHAPMILTGSYWEQNDKVKFIVTIRTANEGKILASAEAMIGKNIVEVSGKSLKPENTQAALIDQKIFAQGETAGGGLMLEAWTNKQIQGNLFVENEKMLITVRVNMPCYIRLLYHMADGTRVLLLNEYYIDQSKVNLAYQLPDTFECAAPFGSEVLQIFARTETFEPVQTKTLNGYEVLTEDLKKFVVATRGMKKAKQTTLQTESRITITTMKD